MWAPLLGLMGCFSPTLECSAEAQLDGKTGVGTATTANREFSDPAEQWESTANSAKSAACGKLCIVELGNTDVADANACAERCMPVATATCQDSRRFW